MQNVKNQKNQEIGKSRELEKVEIGKSRKSEKVENQKKYE